MNFIKFCAVKDLLIVSFSASHTLLGGHRERDAVLHVHRNRKLKPSDAVNSENQLQKYSE